MNEKQDPYTNEWFIPKRRNQIYANRQNQIDYNNEKARIKRELVKDVNKVLLNNRNVIFNILNGDEEKEVSYEYLKGCGFNFGLTTGTKKITDKVFHMYYDTGLHKINNNSFLIISIKWKNL